MSDAGLGVRACSAVRVGIESDRPEVLKWNGKIHLIGDKWLTNNREFVTEKTQLQVSFTYHYNVAKPSNTTTL